MSFVFTCSIYTQSEMSAASAHTIVGTMGRVVSPFQPLPMLHGKQWAESIAVNHPCLFSMVLPCSVLASYIQTF
jgi:hypothetical protein